MTDVSDGHLRGKSCAKNGYPENNFSGSAPLGQLSKFSINGVKILNDLSAVSPKTFTVDLFVNTSLRY